MKEINFKKSSLHSLRSSSGHFTLKVPSVITKTFGKCLVFLLQNLGTLLNSQLGSNLPLLRLIKLSKFIHLVFIINFLSPVLLTFLTSCFLHVFDKIFLCLKCYPFLSNERFIKSFLGTKTFLNISLIDLCFIEPGDMGENITETRNTVVFIWRLIVNRIRV